MWSKEPTVPCLHPLQRSHISSQIGDQICDVLSDEEFLVNIEVSGHSSTLLLDAFEAGCNCFRVCDGAKREIVSPAIEKIPVFNEDVL